MLCVIVGVANRSGSSPKKFENLRRSSRSSERQCSDRSCRQCNPSCLWNAEAGLACDNFLRYQRNIFKFKSDHYTIFDGHELIVDSFSRTGRCKDSHHVISPCSWSFSHNNVTISLCLIFLVWQFSPLTYIVLLLLKNILNTTIIIKTQTAICKFLVTTF